MKLGLSFGGPTQGSLELLVTPVDAGEDSPPYQARMQATVGAEARQWNPDEALGHDGEGLASIMALALPARRPGAPRGAAHNPGRRWQRAVRAARRAPLLRSLEEPRCPGGAVVVRAGGLRSCGGSIGLSAFLDELRLRAASAFGRSPGEAAQLGPGDTHFSRDATEARGLATEGRLAFERVAAVDCCYARCQRRSTPQPRVDPGEHPGVLEGTCVALPRTALLELLA